MGGLALKEHVERKNRLEHEEIVEEVLNELWKFTQAVEIKYFSDKETFGDADIIVLSHNLTGDWKNWCTDNFNTTAYQKNGNVISFEYRKHQIDLILTSKKYYDSSIDYFAFNDLGNLIGRIAHSRGFTYGHRGLTYKLRDGDCIIGEVEISTDIDKIYEFLGFGESKRNFKSL